MVSKLKILFSNGYFGHRNGLFRNHFLILAAWAGTKVQMDLKNESVFFILPTATAIPVCYFFLVYFSIVNPILLTAQPQDPVS